MERWVGKRVSGLRMCHRFGVGVPAFLLGFILGLFFLSASVWATELQIPPVQGKAGQDIRVPLILDEINNLAGLKLILHYDKDILIYKEGEKSPALQSLMHIINDKTPGKLIIVMAGARGIKGKRMTVLTLTFKIREGIAGKRTTAIEIPEVQLMSDDLKEIECKARAGTISILAQ